MVTAKEINELKLKNQGSPLWWAVSHSNVELVRKFLDGGGNPNSRDENDNTCMHIAMKNGDLQIVFALLDYGADLNKKNNKKLTPLFFATPRMLKLLGLEDGNVSSFS